MCDISGWQAVHRAAELEDTECLEALLEYDDTLVISQTRDHTTPLFIAAGLGHIKTAELLLPRLTAEEIATPNIHGCNALYYAVLCDTPSATEIALKLIAKSPDISNIAPYNCTFDCTPYRVVKTKNLPVLRAMINTGMSVDYDCYQQGGFSDSSLYDLADIDYKLAGSTQRLFPGCLLGYCVKFRWPEGLEFLLETHKARLCASPDKEPSFERLLNYEPRPASFSPWALACLMGLTTCFDLMLNVGISVDGSGFGVYSKPCRENTRHREPPLSFTMFPSSMAVHGKIFEKEQLIKRYMALQSIEHFESYCEKKLVTFAERNTQDGEPVDLSRALTFHNPSYRRFHPLDSLSSTLTHHYIRQCPKGDRLNIISDGVQLLLDCGFNFNFRRILTQYESTLCYQNTVSRLLHHSKQGNAKFLILYDLMRRPLQLPITGEALPIATELTGHGILIPSLFGKTQESELNKIMKNGLTAEISAAFLHPHLFILEQLSKRDGSERRAVFDDIYITRNTVCHRLHPIDKQTSSQLIYHKPSYECHWFSIAQLIMKGVKVRFEQADVRKWKSIKRSYTRPKTICYPRVPFSLLVLDDDEFRQRFLDGVLEGVEKPHPAELAWREARVSTLQSKCRTVIRRQIAGPRLMYEPVSRDDCDPSLLKDESWETSYIDQLPIPKLFRPFLKFVPEMNEYSEYYKSFKTERHWI